MGLMLILKNHMSSHTHILGPIWKNIHNNARLKVMIKLLFFYTLISCQATHMDPNHDNSFEAYRIGYGVKGNGNT